MTGSHAEKRGKAKDYRTKEGARAITRIWFLVLAWALLFLFSFRLGRFHVPIDQILRILLSKAADGLRHLIPSIPTMTVTWSANMETAVMLRLPRILLACLVGQALSIAGTTYQSVFQNPMAAPDILGASSGACFGAALAILLGKSQQTITTFAFCCSIVTVGLVYLVASRARGNRLMNLLLAGVMIGSLFSAGTSYIKLVADPSNQLPEITYWMMGSLSNARLKDLKFTVIPMLIGLVPLLLVSWRLNLLSVDEKEVRTMGVSVGALRGLAIFSATLLTAASVAASGMIGWVGLVIPHLSRKLVGNDCRYLFPASIFFGAAFLLLVDDVSRNLLQTEIPIGILTAFLGAPFFIYLMTRKEKLV